MNYSKRRITVVWTLVELLWLILSFGVLSTIPRLARGRAVGGTRLAAIEAQAQEAAERGRTLQRQIQELDAQRRQAELQNAVLGRLLADLRETQVPAFEIRARQAEACAQALDAQNRELASQLRAAELNQAETARELAALQARWAKAEAELRRAEFAVRKELLGLRGELRRTVFVIDRSCSMGLPRPRRVLDRYGTVGRAQPPPTHGRTREAEAAREHERVGSDSRGLPVSGRGLDGLVHRRGSEPKRHSI